MKIIFEYKKCIGCGSCSALCPKNWELGNDGKSHLLDSKLNQERDVYEKEVSEIGCNQDAVDACPEQCIHVE